MLTAKASLKSLLAVALAAAIAVPCALSADDDNDARIVRNINIFTSVYKELNANYVDTINPEHAMETAINAMLDDVDPYTEYIPAREREDFNVVSTGEYGGIGSAITSKSRPVQGVYISMPYANSPAARAGLRAGDRIIAIDGDTVTGLNSTQVSERLRGVKGTSLNITVARPYCGDDSLLTFNIVRETIKMSPVEYYGVERGSVGYISISTFNEHTFQQVRDAVVALKSNPAVKSLVLDLCGNGGGVIDGALQIVGLFVPKGTTVVTVRGRDKLSERVYKTTHDPIDTKIPLAVLIDGGTASASEIVAGALQDLDRAVVIGARSYGKGLVQSVRPLPFDAALKVTTAKYYIPSGRLIQEIDYSHRNADGTYKKGVVDSTRVFHTAHGREVFEGHGITPDITVDFPDPTRLTYNIVRDNWAFDFATKYAAEHPTIAPPATFEVTDDIFDEFKRFIDPDKFEYDKVCETGLKALREVAELEGYATTDTQTAFDQLASLLKHDLGHDLDQHREEISGILAMEILERYYYEPGYAQYAARHNIALDRAATLLADPANWRKILHLAK